MAGSAEPLVPAPPSGGPKVGAAPASPNSRFERLISQCPRLCRRIFTYVINNKKPETFLREHGISSDIAATLLFLIAGSPADAMEVAAKLTPQGDEVEKALIQSIKI